MYGHYESAVALTFPGRSEDAEAIRAVRSVNDEAGDSPIRGLRRPQPHPGCPFLQGTTGTGRPNTAQVSGPRGSTSAT